MDKSKNITRTHKGRLLLWTAAVLAILIPQTLHAAPAGPGDWSKVRLFGHAFRNDDYTPDQYDFIRDNFYLFTIEKRHAKNIYGATSTEKAAAETAKKLLKNNPDMRVLLYWSTNTAYTQFYTTIRDTVAEHPDWVEEVREGTVRWTYPNDAARNWWADMADQLVKDSALNGVFGDGVPGANARGQLESVESCLKRLSSFVIYNGYRVQTSTRCAAGPSTLVYADGVFCEAFFRSSVETADEGVKLMEELLAIPSDKYILCRGAGDGAFGSTHDFSLACYLIIANNYSFYSWGGRRNSYAADDSLIYWSDDFDKEIGEPLGKATQDGYAYHRDFEHCTVDVNLETKTSSIVWKPVDRKITPSKLGQTAKSVSKSKVFNIKNYGAVGDGVALNTEALQKTIDACHAAGGGMVLVPAGKFVTGTLHLKNHITLSLDYGASLLGSQNMKDYPIDHLRPAREGNSECLLYAEDATHIRLEGLGVIDGRGKPEFFPKRARPGGKDNRPRLIRFENCENVTFSGLTYKNPAFWGIHLVDCKEVHLTGVTLRMRNNHSNNDGMDIDGCENVLIENCDIESGDDGICLKSSKNPCRNIVVRHCKVSSHTAALKCGTSSSGGFIDVDVSNCTFFDCPMGAIKLQIVDGGRMENINISRIAMDNVGSPIFIRLGNRGRIYTKNTYTGTNILNGEKPEGARVGSIKGVRISDVVAKVIVQQAAETPTTKEIAKAGPIMIAGIPGHAVEEVLLENISISYPGGIEEDANRMVPEDVTRYPEQYFFGVLPAWGAYIRHAKNIEFKNVEMTLRGSDARQKIVLDDVEGFN